MTNPFHIPQAPDNQRVEPPSSSGAFQGMNFNPSNVGGSGGDIAGTRPLQQSSDATAHSLDNLRSGIEKLLDSIKSKSNFQGFPGNAPGITQMGSGPHSNINGGGANFGGALPGYSPSYTNLGMQGHTSWVNTPNGGSGGNPINAPQTYNPNPGQPYSGDGSGGGNGGAAAAGALTTAYGLASSYGKRNMGDMVAGDYVSTRLAMTGNGGYSSAGRNAVTRQIYNGGFNTVGLSTSDMLGAAQTVSSRGGVGVNDPNFSTQMSRAAAGGIINPLAGAQGATNAMYNQSTNNAYRTFRGLGVNTLDAAGNPMSVTNVANQVANRATRGGNYAALSEKDRLAALGQNGYIGSTYSSLVSRGVISQATADQNLQALTVESGAISKGLAPADLDRLLTQAGGDRNNKGTKDALSQLQKYGIGDSTVEALKSTAADKRDVQGDILPAFNSGLKTATGLIGDFNKALNGFLGTGVGGALGNAFGGASGFAGGVRGFGSSIGGAALLGRAIGGPGALGRMLGGTGSRAATALQGSRLGSGLSSADAALGETGLVGAGAVAAGGVYAAVKGVQNLSNMSSQAHQVIDPIAGDRAALEKELKSVSGLGGFGKGILGSLGLGGKSGEQEIEEKKIIQGLLKNMPPTGGPSTGGYNATGDTTKGTGAGPTGAGKKVFPANGPITAPFGQTRPGHIHQGIDIGAPKGSPIWAAADGVVIFAGPSSGFGHSISIKHNDGVATLYGHMYSVPVRVGQKVTAGQVIANVGADGDSTGPHLHFEVHPGGQAFGGAVNPIPWLGGAAVGTATGAPGGASDAGSSNDANKPTNNQQSGSPGGVGAQTSEAAAIAAALAGGGSSGPASTSQSSNSSTSGSSGAAAGSTPGNLPGGTGNNSIPALQAYAKQLLTAYGWGNQWDAFNKIVMSESGWLYNARSGEKPGAPDSRAYGIPQSLPANKMASAGGDWATNGDTQLKWMMDYIKSGNHGAAGFHDPNSAWAYHQSHNSYAKGSWEIVKDEVAQLHQGEMVVPKATASKLRDAVISDSSGGGGINITFAENSIVIQSATAAQGREAASALVDALSRDGRIQMLGKA